MTVEDKKMLPATKAACVEQKALYVQQERCNSKPPMDWSLSTGVPGNLLQTVHCVLRDKAALESHHRQVLSKTPVFTVGVYTFF